MAFLDRSDWRLRSACVATALLCLLAVPGRLHAQSRGTSSVDESSEPARFLNQTTSNAVVFPTSTKNRLGWRMVVRTPTILTADTMRVEVDFTTTGGPTTADLNLNLLLTPTPLGHAPPQSSLRASLPLRIPEGTSQIRFARHLPKSSFGNFYNVQLLEDGRSVPDCKASIGDQVTRRDSAMYINQSQQMQWRALWVQSPIDESSRVESLKLWSMVNGSFPYYTAATPEEWEQGLRRGDSDGDAAVVALVQPEELPHDWRALRPYDALLMHGDDWRSMSDRGMPAAVALRQWIQAGGILILRGTTAQDHESLPADRYQVASRESLNEATQRILAIAGQYETLAQSNNEGFSREMSYIVTTEEDMQLWEEWLPKAAQQLRESLRNYTTYFASQKAGVQARDELAGMIIFLGERTPESGLNVNRDDSSASESEEVDGPPESPSIEVMQWAAASELAQWRRSRLIRSGVDPIIGSQRFFQWVIPGVSQPPVYTFMGLLGVFVVLVGPVAYRKTAKAGRSYLMFAIAPILAIATTAAMLGYGVIADGFETRARIRQITWVDGTSGDASTRFRSTYFAGIRPSEGLSFPGDSEVTLYPDNQSRGWESRVEDRFESRGLVVATDDELMFSRDFLPSRQQRQFVVHRPLPGWGRVRTSENVSDAPLPVVESPSEKNVLMPTGRVSDEKPLEGPASIMVHCEGPVPLNEVIVCDSKRRYYFAEHVDADASAVAVQISKKHASERMGEMYKRQWLISNVVERRKNNSAYRQDYENEMSDLLSDQLNAFQSVVKPTDGVFEYELQQRMQLQSDLPANSFLALADLTEDSIAIPGANVTDSIHYVIGSLP
ncbi:hypothetical protein [Rhodopirellula sp. SWK7]|uniref:hypothetical protein n=1 Tax=Rhodopirellula sp. SWK7 TaxID=595460 RepID=UPI0002BFCE02|nr:hypothetical protein [Rhodopirellula sp. SWK7]EMI43571.1 signal peptide protein [Rhodopirellula sp. SWK7]